MSATPPEPNTEYSRVPGVSRQTSARRWAGDRAPADGPAGDPPRPAGTGSAASGGRFDAGTEGERSGRAGTGRSPDAGRRAISAAGVLGAVLLVVAEFTTLYTIHAGSGGRVIGSQGTGAHHTYAMVPIAVLAGVLTVGAYRSRTRLPLLAVAGLGIAALAIALAGDLPDAHTQGLTGQFALVNATPRIGLYLETLGAALLLLAGGLGVAMLTPGQRARVPPKRGFTP